MISYKCCQFRRRRDCFAADDGTDVFPSLYLASERAASATVLQIAPSSASSRQGCYRSRPWSLCCVTFGNLTVGLYVFIRRQTVRLLPPLFKFSDKSTATDSSRCPAQELTRSSADAGNPARRDIIRREEKYQQLVGRRTAVSYAKEVRL